MKTQLVHITQGKVFTDTLVIAEQCKVGHETVIGHIRRHKQRFDDLSPIRFKIAKGKKLPQGGFAKSTEYAELNEDQANHVVRVVRWYIIDLWIRVLIEKLNKARFYRTGLFLTHANVL